MSLNISNIIFHQLCKKSDTEMQILFRDSSISINQEIKFLTTDIHRIYERKQKAYGVFNEVSSFLDMLKKFQNNEYDFLAFSSNATKELRNELVKYSFSEGGTVMFCFYSYLAIEYLTIAIIDSRQSSLINDKLDISTIQYLDIEHISIMARINLTELRTEPDSNRYISFIKGRVGRKVSDFFMDFLGAHEGMNTKFLNKTLVRAVNDFCKENRLNEKEAQEVREEAFLYCKSQSESNEEINLKNLSQELSSVSPANFYEFIIQNEYDLDKEFPAETAVVKSLTKYSGSGGGITISFDAELLNERVVWDQQTDTLVIKGVPPNLRDQLHNSMRK